MSDASLVYVPSEQRRPVRRRLPSFFPDAGNRDVWRRLVGWDAVDNGLQAVRFVLLLVDAHYRVAPPRTPWAKVRRPSVYLLTQTLSKASRVALGKWLMIVSEGVANVRRIALMVVWAFSGVAQLLRRSKAEEDEVPSVTERFETLAEVLGNVAEACDVAAFLSGSGLFWGVFGLRREPRGWVQRRRRGVERVGTYVGLLTLVVHVYVLARRNQEIAEDMGESVKTMQMQLEQYDAAVQHDAAAPPSVKETVTQEYKDYVLNRRRLRWLGIERTCLYCDASFTLFEAWAPDAEKDLLEASTGLLAAVLRLLRLWNEARFGALDI